MQVCQICNEAITNPICIDCLEQEALYWARDRDTKLIRQIKNLKKSFDVFDLNTEKCIRCGNEMRVCSHCFLTEIAKLIKDENLRTLFKKSFISF